MYVGLEVGAGQVVIAAVFGADSLGWPTCINCIEQPALCALEAVVAPASAARVLIKLTQEVFFACAEARRGVGG